LSSGLVRTIEHRRGIPEDDFALLGDTRLPESGFPHFTIAIASDDEDNRDDEMHEGEVPREGSQYPCVFTYDDETCPRAFTTKDQLDRHRWKYHNEKTRITFSTPNSDGVKTVTVFREPEIDGKLGCPRCSKKFTTPEAIQAHAQTDCGALKREHPGQPSLETKKKLEVDDWRKYLADEFVKAKTHGGLLATFCSVSFFAHSDALTLSPAVDGSRQFMLVEDHGMIVCVKHQKVMGIRDLESHQRHEDSMRKDEIVHFKKAVDETAANLGCELLAKLPAKRPQFAVGMLAIPDNNQFPPCTLAPIEAYRFALGVRIKRPRASR
jgi:hypothetical protein